MMRVDNYAGLLEALTRDRLETELTTREMEATARRDLGDLHEDHEEVAREELDEARDEVSLFRAALEDARERGGPDGRAEVPYDSADATQDARAGALIQYLVRTEHAEVRTEEPNPGRYVYHVRVDWDRLRRFAEDQGHPIPL